MQIDSAPSDGSVPIKQEDASHSSWQNFPNGLRVLVVDDDPLCLKVIEQMLRRCNYEGTSISSLRRTVETTFRIRCMWCSAATRCPTTTPGGLPLALQCIRVPMEQQRWSSCGTRAMASTWSYQTCTCQVSPAARAAWGAGCNPAIGHPPPTCVSSHAVAPCMARRMTLVTLQHRLATTRHTPWPMEVQQTSSRDMPCMPV
jgi:hypothetical protein